jgi:hypothetical protein
MFSPRKGIAIGSAALSRDENRIDDHSFYPKTGSAITMLMARKAMSSTCISMSGSDTRLMGFTGIIVSSQMRGEQCTDGGFSV